MTMVGAETKSYLLGDIVKMPDVDQPAKVNRTEMDESVDPIHKLDVLLKEDASLIARISAELGRLKTSLDVREDVFVDTTSGDVNVPFRRVELLHAKRRQLLHAYEVIAGRVGSLKNAIDALIVSSYLPEEETRVRAPVSETTHVAETQQSADMSQLDDVAIIKDDAFDADAMREEMERTINQAQATKRPKLSRVFGRQSAT